MGLVKDLVRKPIEPLMSGEDLRGLVPEVDIVGEAVGVVSVNLILPSLFHSNFNDNIKFCKNGLNAATIGRFSRLGQSSQPSL